MNMNGLSVLTMENAAQWDDIVRSFLQYDVYYLSGYVKAFQLHGDGEPLLFYYRGANLRAINVVMKRDIAQDIHFAGKLPERTYFDFATPYGYGGWLLEGEGNPAPLYAAYCNWCQKNGVVSEFVRFQLFSNSRESYYGEVTQRNNNVIRMLNCPIEHMIMTFEHKVRKNLKKAIASGLEVRVDLKGEQLNDFLRIYYGTMNRNNAEQSYYFEESFFNQINVLCGNYVYFHVILNGKVISSELVLLGPKTMYSYLGGTDNAYFSCRPNDFLKYHIIQWGIGKGYQQFVLGGGHGLDDGIFRYKKSFAPDGIVPFYTGQMVFNKSAYQRLISNRKQSEKADYFPAYRA